MSIAPTAPGILTAQGGQLFLEREGDEQPIAVSVRYLRPLSDPTALVFLDEKGKEVATVEGSHVFRDDAQRTVVETALADRYVMPRIERILSIDLEFGTRYWVVDTDRGPRQFALREPGKNVQWLTDTSLVLRDVAGNRFEIPDTRELDPAGLRLLRRMI